jgi:hypothetical protein
LLACLERRGAASGFDEVWRVTTVSLWQALEWAQYARREIEAQDIQFSKTAETSTFTAELCHIESSPEVFVKVRCLPPETMPKARLYVESSGARHFRPAARPTEWYIPVAQGDCVAGVEFDADTHLAAMSKNFQIWPPTSPVSLKVPPQEGGS